MPLSPPCQSTVLCNLNSGVIAEHITPDSQYKLKKFIDDEKLNQSWLDKTLFHLPKLHGSYVNARTGRRTIRGAKAKARIVASIGKAHGNEALTGGKVAKVRKFPPRCIVCCVMNDPKNKIQKSCRQPSIVQFVW